MWRALKVIPVFFQGCFSSSLYTFLSSLYRCFYLPVGWTEREKFIWPAFPAQESGFPLSLLLFGHFLSAGEASSEAFVLVVDVASSSQITPCIYTCMCSSLLMTAVFLVTSVCPVFFEATDQPASMLVVALSLYLQTISFLQCNLSCASLVLLAQKYFLIL